MEKCRRRWDLADMAALKYQFMQAFDRAMNHLDKAFGFSSAQHQYISRKARARPCLQNLTCTLCVRHPECETGPMTCL